MNVDAQFPKKLAPLFTPKRFKSIRGGRGSGKSWGIARALLILGMQRKLRILCTRETQKAMRDSVHKLLVDQIARLGLAAYYKIQQVQITGINGTEFVFAGLSDLTAESIKSFEGSNIVWVEEAQTVTDNSWTILLPTVLRTDGPEVWLTWNPHLDNDATWIRFVEQKDDDLLDIEMNWRDNPWFSQSMDDLRLKDMANRPKYEYEWIWEGKCMPALSGAIYADEVAQLYADKRVGTFPVDPSEPVYAVFDLGFNDSTAITLGQRRVSQLRVIDYLEDSHKTLDWYSKELRAKPYFIAGIYLPHDGANSNIWTAQSAQQTLQGLGWNVTVLARTDVEDGIRAARMAFRQLYIDSRCTRFLDCLKRYTRVIPATTGEPSKPKHDEYSHGADSYRYFVQAAPDFGASAMNLPPMKFARNM